MIQEVLDKKEKTGVTFWTFGVDHYEFKESTVQYENNAKVPNFRINKTCHMGHFSWDMRRCTEIDKFGHKVRNMDANKLRITLTR